MKTRALITDIVQFVISFIRVVSPENSWLDMWHQSRYKMPTNASSTSLHIKTLSRDWRPRYILKLWRLWLLIISVNLRIKSSYFYLKLNLFFKKLIITYNSTYNFIITIFYRNAPHNTSEQTNQSIIRENHVPILFNMLTKRKI